MGQSMTGFGSGETKKANFLVIAEIKSVNHRFKDFRSKLPAGWNKLELGMRSHLNESFKRGSFEVAIFIKEGKERDLFKSLNQEKLQKFLLDVKSFSDDHKLPFSIRLSDFLRPEFSKVDDQDNFSDELEELIMDSFNQAVRSLKVSRDEEGKKLSKALKNHYDSYQDFFAVVLENSKLFESEMKNRLEEKLKNLNIIEIDSQRFYQELAYQLERIDITEEINRIKTHLKKLEGLLTEEKEKGRQIEFVLQELFRETNTIGSKSFLIKISESVVQMKTVLEKMREQALNLE